MDLRELFQIISDYIDRELEADICSEIEECIRRDQESRAFLNTFLETVCICHELEDELEVPEDVHIRLYQTLKIEIITDSDEDLDIF